MLILSHTLPGSFPYVPSQTQQELLRKKYRVAIRIVHRVPFINIANLLTVTQEDPFDNYGREYSVDGVEQ
jgi:hypothetical protein